MVGCERPVDVAVLFCRFVCAAHVVEEALRWVRFVDLRQAAGVPLNYHNRRILDATRTARYEAQQEAKLEAVK